MMQPVTTDHTNAMLGAPADWDPAVHGECLGLPVHRDQANNRWLSWYQPTEQDIANILAGLPIRLSVFGAGHPPVAIGVTAGTEP
ncbi:hypothetical protein Tamer19_17350 [Cupriavidus sp. TA19]|uniref:hypothetical protein n=1 Tax=unclassified Cupriavidus TaxID=2640874 RepID=UPI0027294280|nr:hypothetical protein [Cupriavidus sp. TA19]GLC92327.1 hypothetical protein Tamer19_17350 [Cupriavidus sp. TA19]